MIVAAAFSASRADLEKIISRASVKTTSDDRALSKPATMAPRAEVER